MKRYWSICLMAFLLMTSLWPPKVAVGSVITDPRELLKMYCKDSSLTPYTQEIQKLLNRNDWYQTLTNPVITNRAELEKTDLSCLMINAFLTAQASNIEKNHYSWLPALPAPLDTMLSCTGLFLDIVGRNPSRLSVFSDSFQCYDLSTAAIPVLITLRDSLKLSPPRGYVFVREYRSRESMPAIVQECFAEEKVQAVTILCRYIVILTHPTQIDEHGDLVYGTNQAEFNANLYHELVHAYINSLLGVEKKNRLPKWFHEGCAIHFSGTRSEQVAVYDEIDRRVVKSASEDAEYLRYRKVFKYLEKKLGRPEFYRLISETIQTQSTQPLLTAVSVESYDQLVDRLEHNFWLDNKKPIIILVVIVFIILLLCLLRD